MADARHITLVANTVATVTLDADYDQLEVVNVTGTAAIYFTVNGSTPTVKGDGTFVLPAAVSGWEGEYNRTPVMGPAVVKLISTGTPDVAVRGW